MGMTKWKILGDFIQGPVKENQNTYDDIINIALSL